MVRRLFEQLRGPLRKRAVSTPVVSAHVADSQDHGKSSVVDDSIAQAGAHEALITELDSVGLASRACAECAHYHPLPTTARYIRVMRLHPGHEDEPLRCALHNIDLDDPEILDRYWALSYTWGDASDTCDMSVRCCEGEYYTFAITRTLAAALQQLRRSDKWTSLWVDQICIDQSSLTERQTQVTLMKSIYEKASKVIAWLGPAADDSDLAILKLKETSAMLGDYHDSDYFKMTRNLISAGPKILGEPEPDMVRAWQAVNALFSRSWWERIWILQEASALDFEDTLVTCGSKELPFLDLTWCLLLFEVIELEFYRIEELKFLGDVYTADVRRIIRFKNERHGNRRRRIFDLLSEFGINQASDHRDKINSLLSFASDVCDPGYELVADYSCPTTAMFTNLVIWHARKYKNLDFLAYCYNTAPPLPGHPRWVPEWRVYGDPLDLSATNKVDSENIYSASGNSCDITEVQNIPSSPPTHLKVSGVRVTRVATVVVSIERSAWRTGGQRPWPIDCASRRYAVNDMALDEVLERTVVADTCFPDAEHAMHGRACRGVDFVGFDKVRLLSPENHEIYLTALDRAWQNRMVFSTDEDYLEGLVGLGPDIAEPSDEVWMLKGGSVLYTLRPLLVDESRSHSTLDVTGDRSGLRDYWKGTVVYQYIGECFMVGLMDGEIVDMMGKEPKRSRPATLKEMDTEFRVITLV